MKILFGGHEIKLVDRDVKLAKRLAKKFFRTVKEEAEKKKAPTFYFTFLVVLYLMAFDFIRATSPQTIALLLNAAYKNEENRNSGSR